MTRFRRSGPEPVSRAVKRVLLGAQDRSTVRRMLSVGGKVVVEGDRATITLPTGGFGTFSAALVREVQEALANV